jgi:hypothetical protein
MQKENSLEGERAAFSPWLVFRRKWKTVLGSTET